MLKVSYDDWISGDADVARRLMVGLSPPQQVARSLAVLDVCRSWLPAIPEVNHVAELAPADRWTEAHAAFTAVRRLTLQAESPTVRALLLVAEITAKTIYNASGAPAPFDADSPFWLARNARDFALAVDNDDFTRALWRTLRG